MRREELDTLAAKALSLAPGLSDILLSPGRPWQAGISGELRELSGDGLARLASQDTAAAADCLIGDSPRLLAELKERGSCDLAYEIPGVARFRANIYRQRGNLSLALRLLPSRPPTLAELKLPGIFTDLSRLQNGLVLVTGATGSGKSSSLAALLDEINSKRAVHIITLEDPVEFLHEPRLATFSQRELGEDFPTFAEGLRSALRQAPKIILVGELRDRESLDVALTAAETGHLVLATLHTSDSGQSINRILGLFPESEERMLRQRLAASLRCVVSQRLLPGLMAKRVAAFEVLVVNLRVRELILNGESEDKTFSQTIATGSAYKMQSFDASLLALCEVGEIEDQTALSYASDRAELSRSLDALKSRRGESVSNLGELKLDEGYGKGADEQSDY